jgi:hypothetical protein
VHVPVDDRDPLDAQRLTGVRHRDRDVVEDAEAHARVGDGVVSAGVHERVAVVDPPLHHRVHHRDGATRGERGDLVPAAAERRDAVSGVAPLGELALGHDPVVVLDGVHPQDLLAGRVAGGDLLDLVDESADLDQFVDPPLVVGVGDVERHGLEAGRRVGRGQRAAAGVVPSVERVPEIAGRHGSSRSIRVVGDGAAGPRATTGSVRNRR